MGNLDEEAQNKFSHLKEGVMCFLETNFTQSTMYQVIIPNFTSTCKTFPPGKTNQFT